MVMTYEGKKVWEYGTYISELGLQDVHFNVFVRDHLIVQWN